MRQKSFCYAKAEINLTYGYRDVADWGSQMISQHKKNNSFKAVNTKEFDSWDVQYHHRLTHNL